MCAKEDVDGRVNHPQTSCKLGPLWASLFQADGGRGDPRSTRVGGRCAPGFPGQPQDPVAVEAPQRGTEVDVPLCPCLMRAQGWLRQPRSPPHASRVRPPCLCATCHLPQAPTGSPRPCTNPLKATVWRSLGEGPPQQERFSGMGLSSASRRLGGLAVAGDLNLHHPGGNQPPGSR